MGFHTVSYAFDVPVGSSSVKLVLLALAGNANDETGEAYPSVSFIANRTHQDRKTVIASLDQLVTTGVIEDTGRRMGSTRQVKIYRIVGAPFQTIPKSEPIKESQISPSKSPKFPTKESQISHQRVPFLGHGIYQGISQGIDKGIEPPTAPLGACESDSVGSVDEAKALICSDILKGKNPARPWSYEATENLARLLPIPRREIQLVGWFHRLPDDPEILELRCRRCSESTLVKFWSDEVTRALAYRKKIGGRRLDKPDPEGWRSAADELFGERSDWPTSFWMLTPSARDQILRKLGVAEDEADAPPNWRAIAEQIYGPRDDYPPRFAELTETMQEAIWHAKKEPPKWRQFFYWKYGEEIHLPQAFSGLGADQRAEWDREHEEWENDNSRHCNKRKLPNKLNLGKEGY